MTATDSTTSSNSNHSDGATNAPAPAKKPKRVRYKDLEVRPFTPDDVVHVPPLMKECLGRDVTESWIHWKFFGSPFEGKLGFVVAFHEGELVAFIGANPVPYSVDGELKLVYQHQDTAIREDCRSLGALRGLTEDAELLQGDDKRPVLTYSITTPHMRSLVTKRMKYTVVWESLKMVKLTSLRAYVSKATKSAALASLVPGARAKSWKAPASMTGDVVQITEFGPEFDAFWKEACGPSDSVGRIFPWQDSRWLNYKFVQDELVEFLMYKYVEGGQVLGYVILNVTKLDVRIGYIDSLWTVPGREDVTDLLTDFAMHEFTQHKCDQVSCWTRPDTPVGEALTTRGFVRRPTPQCISVKHLQEGLGDLGLKGEHWNLQRGHTYYTSLGHLAADEGSQRLYKAKEQRDKERTERLKESS